MYGQDAVLFCCFQNSYGTANVSSRHYVEFISEGLSQTKEQLVQENMRGIFDEGINQEGKNSVESDIVSEIDFASAGLFFNMLFDRVTTSDTNYSTHVFNPMTSDFDENIATKPMTFHKSILDVSTTGEQFKDVCASKLEIAFANGELVKSTVGVMGGAREGSTQNFTATYIEGNNAAWDATSVSINGSGSVNVRELTVAIEEPMEAFHTVSTGKVPRRIKRSGKRVVNVSGTLLFDNYEEYTLFTGQTDFPLVVNCDDGIAGDQSIILDMPKCRFTEFPIDVGAPGEFEVSFTAKAQYHSGSGTAITATVVNSMRGY